nr:MAG TPA: hypothetical protein [Caudoviricetes sp.]
MIFPYREIVGCMNSNVFAQTIFLDFLFDFFDNSNFI